MIRFILLTTFYFLTPATMCFPQAELISIIPNIGYPGESLNIIIRGNDTHFVNGVSMADFGPGITVDRFQVSDALTGTATISIDASATPGLRAVIVRTVTEVAMMEDGFEVLEPGANLTVRLEVVPVEVLYLADFNPANIASAPLLFTITLVNDNMERELILRMTVSGEQYGNVVVTTKALKSVLPNMTSMITNRDFDDYNTSVAGAELIKIATQTGMLPADTYHYVIQVIDQTGNVLASDEATNTTTNLVAELELIAPGCPFDHAPEIIYNSHPYFQWFSRANVFDFALYQVNPGQTSAEDVVETRPVFAENGLTTTFFLYPNYAEILEEGITYAWQVKAHITSSGGKQLVSSEVYWFSVGTTDTLTSSITRIEVIPAEIELVTGQSYQFKARVFTENDEEISVIPKWRVVAPEFGEIDDRGLFNAGKRPGTVAIVASYDDVHNYSTVTINWDIKSTFDFKRFFRELLGLE